MINAGRLNIVACPGGRYESECATNIRTGCETAGGESFSLTPGLFVAGFGIFFEAQVFAVENQVSEVMQPVADIKIGTMRCQLQLQRQMPVSEYKVIDAGVFFQYP